MAHGAVVLHDNSGRDPAWIHPFRKRNLAHNVGFEPVNLDRTASVDGRNPEVHRRHDNREVPASRRRFCELCPGLVASGHFYADHDLRQSNDLAEFGRNKVNIHMLGGQPVVAVERLNFQDRPFAFHDLDYLRCQHGHHMIGLGGAERHDDHG
ncbi:MAG: hypothetical protein C6W59_08655 [Paenibacillaceae bacterium]|nr:MAG: hypothetical protein C6W59_08655 [Paenibacillaceae bacterium]